MNDISDPQARHAYWQQQVKIWKESGLSDTKFCKAYNLSYHRLVCWRQKLDCSTVPKKTVPAAGGFGRITVQPERDGGLSLTLPSGLIVRGISAANNQWCVNFWINADDAVSSTREQHATHNKEM